MKNISEGREPGTRDREYAYHQEESQIVISRIPTEDIHICRSLFAWHIHQVLQMLSFSTECTGCPAFRN